ncbi:MAG: Ig-like domain-containing protein [Gammaproteobacteria bacterium]|nr:Ig-like domain-containing protein [Gammaproteobacteria bacterium]
MERENYRAAWPLIISFVLFFTACGGGSSDDDDNTRNDLTYPLTITIVGIGSVSDSTQSFTCNSSCVQTVNEGDNIVLSATAGDGYQFDGWSGDCTSQLFCSVAMSAARSATATFSSVSGNQPPNAEITGPTAADINDAVTLSAVNSSDPDLDPLSYSWQLTAQPATSSANLSNTNQVTTVLTPDVEGTYQIQLTANDGQDDDSANHTVTVDVMPPTDTVGSISLSPSSFLPGAVLSITVADDDLNTINNSMQTVDVSVVNQVTNETEVVTLMESGNDSGIFTSTLTTQDAAGPGANNNGALNVEVGETVQATYQDAAPAGARTDTSNVVATQARGVDGEWPFVALIPPSQSCGAYWGCTEPSSGAVTDCDDVNANGTPDIVEGSGVNHHWYDDLAAVDNVNNNGDRLREAWNSARGMNGVLCIIGKGAADPYDMVYTREDPSDKSGYIYFGSDIDIEIVAVEDHAWIRNVDWTDTGSTTDSWILRGRGSTSIKNIHIEGIEADLPRIYPEMEVLSFQNFRMENVQSECPNTGANQSDTDEGDDLRVKQLAAGPGSGGISDDPIRHHRIEYINTEILNCDSNGQHHSVYWSQNNCTFIADNARFLGHGNLEVFRELCRFGYYNSVTMSNSIDFENSNVHGESVLDIHGPSFHYFNDVHFQVMGGGVRAGGSNSAIRPQAIVPRSRRAHAGSMMPNQWPGRDAGTDDYAGNDDWIANPCTNDDVGPCPELTDAIDDFEHAGKLWDRTGFWQDVTSKPWRGDQRTLTMASGHSVAIGDNIAQASSSAGGFVWKVSGNTAEIYLTGDEEFSTGALDAGKGSISTYTPVSAEALAGNGHMFPVFISNSTFEAKCVRSGGCGANWSPFNSNGTIPGAASAIRGGGTNSNIYFIVPRDSDTPSAPGDGWVERNIWFLANVDLVGDWNVTNDVSTDTLDLMSFNDGTYDLSVYESAVTGFVEYSAAPIPGAMKPGVYPEATYFFVDLGDSVTLPAWWPQGSAASVCAFGNNFVDWWDEPMAVTAANVTTAFPVMACP